MLSLQELEALLEGSGADFQLLHQARPIRSAQDAQGIYEVERSAPTFVLQTEEGLVACIASVGRGRLNFGEMKEQMGYAKLKLADGKKIQAQTGYSVGSIPLVGHGLPCIFDDRLLEFDYVYGGTGDELVTLKIAPQDLMKLNQVIHHLA